MLPVASCLNFTTVVESLMHCVSQGGGSPSMRYTSKIPGCAYNSLSKHCIDSLCAMRWAEQFKFRISFHARNNSY